MSELRNCPKCGAEDALETFLRLDLDDVVLKSSEPRYEGDWRKWVVADFVPASSANIPETGIVFEEATVSCRECGHQIDDADFEWSIGDRWAYASGGQ